MQDLEVLWLCKVCGYIWHVQQKRTGKSVMFEDDYLSPLVLELINLGKHVKDFTMFKEWILT